MFRDRFDAAHQLANQLRSYNNRNDVVIVAIPRGGLQIGSVLSQELHAPLDVIFSKKISAPSNEEYAIGAIGLHSEIIDREYAHDPALSAYIDSERTRIRQQLRERYTFYKNNKAPLSLANKIVILADDGIATGHTFFLAIKEIKQQSPKKIIAAIPVLTRDTLHRLQKVVDKIVYLIVPELFFGISQFYQQFPQVEDEEALRLLRERNL